MEIPNNIQIINQLKLGSSVSFKLLYERYFPPIVKFVMQNSGTKEDAEDIFQETIMVLLVKIKQQDFALTSSLKSYLFAIAKNIWLKRLRKEKNHVEFKLDAFEHDHLIYPMELVADKTREEKVETWLTMITVNCQQVLKAIFYNSETMQNLMQKMGWKNKHTAANQQYKCIQQLKRLRIQDKAIS